MSPDEPGAKPRDAEPCPGDHTVVNEFHGVADVVVQAGSVERLVVNHHAPSAPRWPHRVGAVPARAGCFQHRELAARLDERIAHDHAVVLTGSRPAAAEVLSGAGGVGKTQLAADCAERMWERGEAELLMWVHAGSRAAIMNAYAAAAAELGWDGGGESGRGAERFLAGLAALPKRWLVVLDDLRSPGDVKGLWPPETERGRTLVTTRRRDGALTNDRRGLLPVGEFVPAESLAYLTARLAEDPRQAAGAELLAADLGHLPLALSQAAAYIIDEDLDCHRYRELLADRHRRLADVLPEPEALPDDHHETVSATWSLSIELAGRLHPAGLAPRVLEIAALLDAGGIPIEVLSSSAVCEHLAEATGTAVDERAVHSAVRCLHRLNLATDDARTDERTVRVHALVQRATREELHGADLDRAIHAAADGLVEVWQPDEHVVGPDRALRANAEALHSREPRHLYEHGGHPVVHRIAESLSGSGLDASAAHYYERMHVATANHLGPDHPRTLYLRKCLITCEADAGDVVAAVPAFERLLTDQLRISDADDPSVLTTREVLAMSRIRSGDVARGVSELRSLVPEVVRVLGADHRASRRIKLSAASYRAEVGDVAGAVAELEEVLAEHLRMPGPDHPDTLTIRHNLALRQGEAGDADTAVRSFEKLLEDRLRVMGADHPNTLQARSVLASNRADAGDVEGAMAELATLLADRQRLLGADHPDTLATRRTSAKLRGEAGDDHGALRDLTELLPDVLRVMGPRHPDTFTLRHTIAVRRGYAGDAATALAELEALLSDESQVLGRDDPDLLVTRHNVAFWRARADDPRAALAELEKLLSDMLRVLGPDHVHTRATRTNIENLGGDPDSA
ncbi:tetratricopeptide repeat protein [Saccharopolyspora sp. NFXS83]|uniref:tetratricopeptide repeat protein n=1 Tax=Saccharopolyspora sp. NFXS83 TaxID=2993560 RepID=UPI00224B50F9|nr:tetratricopeptide repeat protein [Saccharopolyspora sp. NFXS83]MCX2731814.1 tetratricopeptide repeat protein [Saccharopolyspora sp. NFXS83]